MPSLCPLAAEVNFCCSTVHCLCFNCIFTSRCILRGTPCLSEAVEESHAHANTVMQARRPEASSVQAWRPALRRW